MGKVGSCRSIIIIDYFEMLLLLRVLSYDYHEQLVHIYMLVLKRLLFHFCFSHEFSSDQL